MEDNWDEAVSWNEYRFCHSTGNRKTKSYQMSEQRQQDFIIAYAIDRMTEFLIEDYQIEIPQALQYIYNSETYQKLQKTENGLFIQSPSYIYELLNKEYQSGQFS